MWFKDRFGVVPEEKGLMMFTFMRNRFFIKSPWVIFAPNEKTAKAVDKGQSVIEFALNWSLSAILIVGCLAVCLFIFCHGLWFGPAWNFFHCGVSGLFVNHGCFDYLLSKKQVAE